MKTNTKIWLLIFIMSLVGSVLTTSYLLNSIVIVNNQIEINMTTLSYIGLVFVIVNTISGNVLFFKFLKMQKFNSLLFFSTVPLTIMFGAGMYTLATINNYKASTFNIVKTALKISTTNNNNLYWIIVLAIIYFVILFFLFTILARPIKKVEKATIRLSYGDVKNSITIGGGKDFKEIEYSLNKINENYRQKDNLIEKTNLEYEKFIPKQILKLFNKKTALDLEIGAKVQKVVTTMFCDIRNSLAVGNTLSLEENFNYINSYLNIVNPIVRKYGGFVDKYLNDSIIAVFFEPVHAINCAHAIIKKIKNKNLENPNLPNLDVGICLNTENVMFGVIGDEQRKSATIVSDSTMIVQKMAEFNIEFSSSFIMSKNTLSALPSNAELYYRYVGLIEVNDKKEVVAIFESLEIYSRQKREKLIKYKTNFEQAVRLFNNGKYEQAKLSFEKVYKLEKEDKVCYIYFNKASHLTGASPIRD